MKARLAEGRGLLRKLKGGISNKILNRILNLKKSLEEKYESISGAYEVDSRALNPETQTLNIQALEEVQADDDMMEMMHLTPTCHGPTRDVSAAPGTSKGSQHFNLMQVWSIHHPQTSARNTLNPKPQTPNSDLSIRHPQTSARNALNPKPDVGRAFARCTP